MSSGWGFKGPECLECGGVRSKVGESGYTLDGQRIRLRRCLDCGQRGSSIEIYLHPDETTFFRLNGRKVAEREAEYEREGKGVFRVPQRWTGPDRVRVRVLVRKGRAA